jgi:arabinogalactan oligomer / maltooligosaccharide transport system permease protein
MKVYDFRAKSFKFLLSYIVIFTLLIMALRFIQNRSWFLGFFFLISAFLVGYIYTLQKKVPSKYLLPGFLLLFLFHIYPAFFSGYVAFTNDSNGHQISKSDAIASIIESSNIPASDIPPIEFRAATEDSTKKLFVTFQYPAGKYWVGNTSSLREVGSQDPAGFTILNISQTQSMANDLGNIQVHMAGGLIFSPQDFKTLQAGKPVMVYNAAKDELTNIESGVVYRPNNNGQMVSAQGEALDPGWKENIGLRNFTSIIQNKEIRKPLLAVLAWTIINAILIIILSFLFGLCLALIFNFPRLASKRIYRTIFIVPMAIPNVLSVLVWAGLFTTQTGVIDRLFHTDIPWLTDSLWARIAVLIVELWLTFPYMFLITTGAIQAIPKEIVEAAEIDGASVFKSFRMIKLPLVMRTLAPLLVASMAMALNNFGAIYLLTGGGPTFPNTNGNAGATDILISYTYKLAFNGQEGNNYGLASALSILNFILVGGISIYGLRRMKTMEGIN